MARARNIKPAIFKNELLGVADPYITILFTSLWCLADRLGRLEDRPLRIKAETFPYREGLDVNGYLTELERLEFICRYEVDGSRFIQIINFEKHQAPHKTEKESVIPCMKENSIKSYSCDLTVKQPLNNDGKQEALPPDLLIPDSLIPDLLITEKSQAPTFNFKKELEILGVEEKAITTWLAVRKKKKAVNSEIALDALKREAIKAGLSIADAVHLCGEKSWAGLDASWIRPNSQSAPIAQKGLEHLGKHGQATATAAQQWLEESNAGE